MKITAIDSGYVDLVSGVYLADSGNNELCLDVSPRLIAVLNSGDVPIYEPGLDEIIKRNVEAGRFCATTDGAISVTHGLMQMIAVGNPSGEYGSVDLRYAYNPKDMQQETNAPVIVTEWKTFKSPDSNVIKSKLKNSTIFGGRNLVAPIVIKALGIEYYGLGRRICSSSIFHKRQIKKKSLLNFLICNLPC